MAELYRESRYKRLKAEGRCVICARAAAKPGRTMCPACAAKAAARTREDTAAKRKDWEELSRRLLQLEEENAELRRRLSEKEK